MIEFIDYHAQYQSLLPIERNAELKRLAEEAKILETPKFGEEDQFNTLFYKLEILLSLAPVTSSFIELFRSRIARDATIRIITSIRTAEDNITYWFIDQDGPGIFDEQTAIFFDQRGYQNSARNLMDIHATLDQRATNLGIDPEMYSDNILINFPIPSLSLFNHSILDSANIYL